MTLRTTDDFVRQGIEQCPGDLLGLVCFNDAIKMLTYHVLHRHGLYV